VNIVPVIAKSDCLTQKEISQMKRKILQEIQENGIKIYSLPDCDSDEDEDFKQQVQQLRESIPFAVVGANAMVEVGGKKIRGRQYPWGVVEVENPAHCDFVKLRTMLITHMQDLQEVTHDVHYENYRSHRLAKGSGGQAPATNPSAPPPPTPRRALDEKDKQLQEKEAELRRMQEMVAAMQEQIKQQSVSSLQSLVSNQQ
jgi:septin 2